MTSNSLKPKRSCTRRDYREMVRLSIPKPSRKTANTKQEVSENARKLFRLEIVDENARNETVKVHYIGYSSRFDEWRAKIDVVDLSDDINTVPEGSELADNVEDMSCLDSGPFSAVLKPFSLYEELAYKIKCLLLSSRKGDPTCCVSMTFDSTHFDGLIRRGTLVKGWQTVYSVSLLTTLDDILGQRWYIRGINQAGDFCYVKPGTVRYQLKFIKGRSDFQILEDGTLKEYTYGQRYQLTFKFIRIDGIVSQWHDVIELCKK